MNIETLFQTNHIAYQKVDHSNDLFQSTLPEGIVAYLKCTGTTIKLNLTPHGSAYTTLFSVHDIKQEQYSVCMENELLVIGYGLNGDLLTINLSNQHVGYVFHDKLLEKDFDTIDDIYVELPFKIDEFLNMAIEGTDYPIDGNMAEEYISKNK